MQTAGTTRKRNVEARGTRNLIRAVLPYMGRAFPVSGRLKNLLAHKYLSCGIGNPKMPSVSLVSSE